ncbi:hypothetical protein N7474_005418 [Penicillium riverlandense]|uniref:uncharacterized protein n=1 Tax=Penicillium riverlandense TaxID=1903569 RepID=UPI0025467FF1|nr:uncharacterized protein N7474_005418 [Penicillium riverlandense]KAJ5819827.1 hypothetical protein N7474_005418 [Penicillium riverlandense]
MAIKSYLQWAAVLAASAQLGAAQTYTSCNPLKKTCPADTGLDQYRLNTDFTTGSSAFNHWNTTGGTVESTSLGAKFTIAEEGDAPTIESDFYIFFGYVEIKMRAANGTGIISTAVMESDDLDEIDWVCSSIETDYFGKGNTTSYDRDTTVSVSSPEETFHTYAVDWTSSKIEWLLDGKVVRTLDYAAAVDGTNFPQTPMRIKIGIWAGGDPNNAKGTIEWAGGETDYTNGPFTMYVESVNIINYNPAQSYKYTDKTGSYTSIKTSNGTTSTNLIASSSSSNSTARSSALASAKVSSSAAAASASASASSSSATSTSAAAYFSPLLGIVLAAFLAGMVHV